MRNKIIIFLIRHYSIYLYSHGYEISVFKTCFNIFHTNNLHLTHFYLFFINLKIIYETVLHLQREIILDFKEPKNVLLY